jgi:hypothetical protein
MKKLILTSVFTLVLSAGSALAAGVIAVDAQVGDTAEETGYGVGFGATVADATREAMKFCKSYGNDDCDVGVSFEKGECAAYAVSRDYYGIGHGIREDLAVKRAIEDCDDNCKLVTSACD